LARVLLLAFAYLCKDLAERAARVSLKQQKAPGDELLVGTRAAAVRICSISTPFGPGSPRLLAETERRVSKWSII
jgi:hypothetical protein